MDKQYDPKKVESKIYQLWEESGFFNPDKLPPLARGKKRKEPFCIIMPPPNANGLLHLGHAVFVVLEDILTRFERLRGKAALWLPGADHAGFETQVVFEKELEKQGKTRFQFSREELYQMMWDFTQKNKVAMESQLRQLGASCDWSREKFTLDEDIIKIVYQIFERLCDNGLVYRGKRVINWCVHHQTSLSDLEVVYEERSASLNYIKYPLVNDGGFILVATTRPETMLGDTAVAVNPKDKRYQKLIGQKAILPIQNREIPIIADEAVEPEFGTGAVKITPAHDAVDFEISQRHSLSIIQVIGEDGKMTREAGAEFVGLKVIEARQKVLEKLRELGLLEREEPYNHSIALCYKCKKIIEPIVSKQWFIKIKSLADKAVRAVTSGQVKFHPKRYEKIFFNWMEKIRDWNISRQIVWGIKIPVWYCRAPLSSGARSAEASRSETKADRICFVISDEKPEKCPKCGATEFQPETDTFDTWFSSGQWPFATLSTTKKGDFEKFYPTSVMETAWDILFFWVARMIMLGIYVTGKVPFHHVLLHGLVRDKDKQKMSKSKGNVIDPMGVVNEHGADALRMALVFSVSTGSDIAFSEDKIIAQKRFANKIWNAARFVISSLGKDFNPKKIKPHYSKNDKWILGELDKAAKKITKDLENYKFHEAAQSAYHFFWHSFCDKCIENVKTRIKKATGDQDKKTAQYVLWKVLTDSLKFLHPFMPFITEAIYQQIPHRAKKALIVENWPQA